MAKGPVSTRLNLSKLDSGLIWLTVIGIGALVLMPAPSYLTRNFRREEFETSRDGLRIPLILYPNLKRLANELQKIRDIVGPITIYSGWRSPAYNEKVNGAEYSQHLLAAAADIFAPQYAGGDERALHSLILRMIQDGRLHNGGVGLYPRSGSGGWVHYDVRRFSARWQG